MRDFLVPIFGSWGAVVAQFLLTVIIVLGLIGAVWWFMRRYSGVHFGGIGRGRVPRLAVIDVMPVDRRRRLVLVRRDNVEHLLLVGGPSDVVVEGAIQRVRQRSAQQAAQVAAARAAMQPAIDGPPAALPEVPQLDTASPEEPTASEPIPFPVPRDAHPPAASGNGRPPLRPVRQPPPGPLPEASAEQPAVAPTAAFVEPQHPTRLQAVRIRPVAAPPPQPQPHDIHDMEEPAAEALLPEAMEEEAPPPPPAEPAPATFAEAEREAAEAARQSALDLGDGEAPATAAEQVETVPAKSAARVSDLEREMARLLDEITTRRST